MKTSMSLHRVIAEIKSLEEKLSRLSGQAFVAVVVGDDAIAVEKTAVAKKASQSQFDSTVSQMTNLAALKSARNKANSVIPVTIGGVEMTIDEALARKAALPFKVTLANTLQAQFNAAQRLVDSNTAQIEAKVAQQLATMFTSTRKATEDEITVIRTAAERNAKAVMVFADGLKERVDVLKKEIEDFTTEVDFVLSEANALNKVEVELV